jgi:DNA-binding response OmpR family regulator
MDRILLVDDEPLLRRAFRALLEASGYAVSEAGSGGEAIAVALADQPSLILLDIGLPDRSGLDVARELAANTETRGIPIIAMTGRSGETIGRECSDAGCADTLTKPITPTELVRRIPAWLGQPPTAAPAESRV